MANKHIGCSKLNVIRKMRLKELWNTTTHLLEWQKNWAQTTGNANKDVEWENLPFTTSGKVKWYRHFGRQSDIFLKNSEYFFFQTKNSLVLFTQKNGNLYPQTSHQKTYTWMFLAVLFKIATTWNQSWYSSESEWINWDIVRQWNTIKW